MDTTDPRPIRHVRRRRPNYRTARPHRRGVGRSAGAGAQAHDAACPGPGQPAVPGRRDGERRAKRRPRSHRHTCGRRVRLDSPDLHRPGDQCVGARRVGRRNLVGLLAAVDALRRPRLLHGQCPRGWHPWRRLPGHRRGRSRPKRQHRHGSRCRGSGRGRRRHRCTRVISSGVATNGIGVYGLNNSQYDGPVPGAGGFGVTGSRPRATGSSARHRPPARPRSSARPTACRARTPPRSTDRWR